MFNNFAKFELPAVRGDQLWPNTMQAPTMVRASLSYDPVGDDLPHHAEMLTNYFHELVDNHTPEILNFLTTQRRNYQLGVVDFSSTQRSVGPLALHYTNMQGSLETLRIEGIISSEKFKELEEAFLAKVEFAEEEFLEPTKQKRREDEEPMTGLMMVVFHDGNKVSYIPMSSVGKPSGNASRVTLKKSNWGTDIVKVCQIQFSKNYSVIYSALSGLVNGILIASDWYYFADSNLINELPTRVSHKYEYPMMNGEGDRVYLPIDTVELDATGKILSSQHIVYTTRGASAFVSGRYSPFYISSTGLRHTEYAVLHDPLSQGSFMPPIRAYIYGEGDFADGLLGKQSGVYNTGYDPESNNPTNPYNISWIDAIDLKSGGDDVYTSIDGPLAYAIDGKLTTNDTVTPVPVTVGTVVYNGLMYDANLSVSFQRVKPDRSVGDLFIDVYRHIYVPVTTDSYEIDEFNDYSYGPYARSTQYEYSNILGYNPSINNTEYLNLQIIPWPPTSGDLPWHLYTISKTVWGDPTYVYIVGIGGSKLITPYGEIQTNMVAESFFVAYESSYKSWLHTSNKDHVLQGFEINGQRYMYLDDQQMTSLIGVPVDNIQAVLFDIPMEKIDQFK